LELIILPGGTLLSSRSRRRTESRGERLSKPPAQRVLLLGELRNCWWAVRNARERALILQLSSQMMKNEFEYVMEKYYPRILWCQKKLLKSTHIIGTQAASFLNDK